jgi:hypothetical protein
MFMIVVLYKQREISRWFINRERYLDGLIDRMLYRYSIVDKTNY